MNPRDLLDELPDETLVPVHFVRRLLSEAAVDDTEPLADLDVAAVAQALSRKPSTIRAWLHAGELEGYKLRGREWRVTREALRRYQDEQRQRKVESGKRLREGRDVDLGIAWRKVRAKA